MSLSVVERYAWHVRTVLMVILLLRLAQMRVLGRYPWLAAYLAVSTVRTLVLASLNYASNAYAWTYFYTEPLIWLGYAAVCWEIYGQVFEHYQGISLMSRRGLAGVLTASFLVALLSTAREANYAWERFPILLTLTLSNRLVVSTFFIFLALVLGFLLWFRIPLRRNVIVYAVAFSFFFLFMGASYFVRNIGGADAIHRSNVLMLTMLDVTLVGWLVVLRAQGEELEARLGARPTPETEQQLLASLEELNRLALGTTKRM